MSDRDWVPDQPTDGNWVVDVDKMLCCNIGRSQVFKILYVESEDKIYSLDCEGTRDICWNECVSEIRDEYIKQREILAERILLSLQIRSDMIANSLAKDKDAGEK